MDGAIWERDMRLMKRLWRRVRERVRAAWVHLTARPRRRRRDQEFFNTQLRELERHRGFTLDERARREAMNQNNAEWLTRRRRDRY